MEVDERIIPTKSKSDLKQYNAKKPHKWSYNTTILKQTLKQCNNIIQKETMWKYMNMNNNF
jgi:hypothetical protein